MCEQQHAYGRLYACDSPRVLHTVCCTPATPSACTPASFLFVALCWRACIQIINALVVKNGAETQEHLVDRRFTSHKAVVYTDFTKLEPHAGHTNFPEFQTFRTTRGSHQFPRIPDFYPS